MLTLREDNFSAPKSSRQTKTSPKNNITLSAAPENKDIEDKQARMKSASLSKVRRVANHATAQRIRMFSVN